MYASIARIPLYVRIWLVLVFVVSLFAIGLYASAHFVLRQDASDPQIQIAEDTAASISVTGQFPATTTPVNMMSGLAPFISVYDAKGNILQSGGVVENRVPVLPREVFEEAGVRGEDRFTWKPFDDVLFAGVLVRYANASSSGYVLVARSLREVESRERSLFGIAATTWLLAVLGSLALMLVFFESKTAKARR
jgi:hypothetical protein